MRALVLRDLRLALRAGGGFGLGLAFLLVVVLLVPFGVGPDQALLRPVAPGILWVGALLAVLLSLERIFALDHEDGSLVLIMTAPIPGEGVALAKAGAHWLTTGVPITLAAPGGIYWWARGRLGIRSTPLTLPAAVPAKPPGGSDF